MPAWLNACPCVCLCAARLCMRRLVIPGHVCLGRCLRLSGAGTKAGWCHLKACLLWFIVDGLLPRADGVLVLVMQCSFHVDVLYGMNLDTG